MELTLDQALQKGVEAHKAGKVQEADRYYTAILKANPKHPDANHNMGVLAVGVGKVEEALPFFKTGLEANPKIDQFWLSYIDALIKLDRMDDAKAVFDQAKSKGAKGDGFDQIEKRLNTSSVEVKNERQEVSPNQPNIFDELKLDQALELAKKKIKDGLSEEAKKIYQDILKKFPKNKKALDGIKTLASKPLANTSDIGEPPGDQLQSLVNLYTKGQYKEALIQAAQLLEQYPNSVNLYNIIGVVNKNMGKLDEALEAYNKALAIKPDYAEAYYNMGIILQGVIFNKPNKDLQKKIASLLDKKTWFRPNDISRAAISLLKLEPSLQEHLQLGIGEVIQSPLDVISDLSDLPLLLKLMNVCPLSDLELEKLFKKLRKSILLNLSSLKEASPELIEFQSALALQCFTNEYI